MHHTAWTKKGSSVPSDWIAPKSQPQAAPARPKGKQKDSTPPKSKEVRRLEKLRDDLRKSSGREKDPKGGCFCQARLHPLSPYTPICRACGLILCELNLPNFACPHCGAGLLTTATLDSLVQTLDDRIADTIAREEEERQRAAQEARSAEGAFPTLSVAASRVSCPDAQSSHPVNQTHKVLSLDSKTRKVKVSTFTPPAVSRNTSTEKLSKEVEPEHKRVPPPPAEVVCASAPSSQRPWANMRGLDVSYVRPSRA
ncbi:hypothetical protein BN946_scf184938.g37 [Trametes cinnabarina]|uniref:TRIP4/RQT4 C2HC5-type zinc finger domain-containing protein n=1 Tax=Pycnoporus cinnabarinus TaxID=5643 RepID=A0A060S1L5_PYCCI|nr:hypothetical protein BN946_scf184938.g37 [Trametes cinnabarina]